MSETFNCPIDCVSFLVKTINGQKICVNFADRFVSRGTTPVSVLQNDVDGNIIVEVVMLESMLMN